VSVRRLSTAAHFRRPHPFGNRLTVIRASPGMVPLLRLAVWKLRLQPGGRRAHGALTGGYIGVDVFFVISRFCGCATGRPTGPGTGA
jgi:peptidoglycan/LPS O-acetylase OafA/YrhL